MLDSGLYYAVVTNWHSILVLLKLILQPAYILRDWEEGAVEQGIGHTGQGGSVVFVFSWLNMGQLNFKGLKCFQVGLPLTPAPGFPPKGISGPSPTSALRVGPAWGGYRNGGLKGLGPTKPTTLLTSQVGSRERAIPALPSVLPRAIPAPSLLTQHHREHIILPRD